MPRMILVGAILLAAVPYGLPGQAPDTRLDDAVKEIALLKRMVADQDRRVASLERTVKALQATIRVPARPIPTSWRTQEGWAALKIGMSRAQVVEILGEPGSTDFVIDRQTLLYKNAADLLVGNVVITDDRVSEIASDWFQIYVPSRK
ncbi:MAG TPA: outer membrane protein assembly factor BamE [Bryobacteraceae bacterium]|nr:outer membrane protein assembly factor BamE [Bryobacteraceae bacterium]